MLFLRLTANIKLKVAAVGVTSVVILACAYVSGSLPQVAKFSHPESHVVDVAVGREGVVAVVQRRPDDLALVKNNTYVLGSSAAQFDQERQAHIPLLLHGKARDVAAIGVATGGTIGGIVLHPHVEHVDAIELSPLALEFARQHFGPYNRAASEDPRIEMHQEDARWVIAGKTAAYDVIIGDLFEPWGTGVGRLYTIQHLLEVRKALKPGGLFCQWLPMIQLTQSEFNSIARTFQEVFPQSVLVRRDFYVEHGVLGLVGNLDLKSHDWHRVARACEELRTVNHVRDPIARHVDGIAMMVVGPITGDPAAPRITLGNAWLELHAAHNILLRRERWFNDAHLVQYVGELHQKSHSLMPTALRSVHALGQFYYESELAFEQNPRNWRQLSAQAQRRIPESIARDPDVDWSQWPMGLRPAKK